MKKTFLITALTILLTAPVANAFDLGKVASSLTSDNCTTQALILAKKTQGGALNLFDKLSADSTLTASDLNVSDETLNLTISYIEEGCAKDHITKALSAGAVLLH